MPITRRNFIRKTSMVTAGTALFSGQLLAATRKERITGLQLYSVRDDMRSAPLDTLKKLAAFGYTYVEHAGYRDGKFYGYPAIAFKKILDDLGLKMISGHTVFTPAHWDGARKDFSDTWKQTVADAAVMGQRFVISPSMSENLRDNYDGLMSWLDVYNRCGELCKKSGMKFGYHNHNFEFASRLQGITIYDLILKHTDPSLVAQQLDIGNLYGVGARSLEILKKYPGRFELMHVKDEMKSPGKGEMNDGYDSTVLGKGITGVRDIINAGLAKGGTKYFIIEQESYQALTPLEAANQNLQVMRKWGFR